MLKICIGVLGGEIEHFLHDPRNGLAVPIRNGEQAKIIAFAQKCVGGSHVTARDHGAAPDRHEINNHEHDGKDRQEKERYHHRPGVDECIHDRLRVRNFGHQRRRSVLCEQRKCACQRGKHQE